MAFLLGNALGANPISRYADTRGRRAGLLLSLTFFGIFGLLATVSVNVYMFMILRLCQGLLFPGRLFGLPFINAKKFRLWCHQLGSCL